MEKDRCPAAQQGNVGQDRQRRPVHAEVGEVQSRRHQQGAQRLLFREVAGCAQGLLRCGDQGGDRQPRGHSEGTCRWCAPGEQRCKITAANARRGCARRAVRKDGPKMSEVVLSKVNKYYGEVHHAVKDVDLAIADEEFVALVGPSGCGKSTTLRMIAGLEDISTGEIRIGDRVVNALPPRDRDVAMVFQNYALYQHMSVYDNLAFGLRNKKVPEDKIKKEIDRAVGILGLNELLQRKPRQLSGGQQQRVALGRCIVRNPKVFLFDEPLSNLDAQLRAQMRLEIKELRQRVPTTSVFVTHDQVEAMTLGDRIVVMKDGLMQQVGSPLELYRRPVNRFVASFIGSPAMNFIDMAVTTAADTFSLSANGIAIALPQRRFAGLGAHAGRTVTMGVRPQHLSLGSDISQCGFDAGVEVVEQLGSEIILETRLGDARVTIARVDPQVSFRVGETVRLSVQPERLHFFDPITEVAIRWATWNEPRYITITPISADKTPSPSSRTMRSSRPRYMARRCV